MQRHPAKNAVLHVDLQRVLENEKIRITIPLHFKGDAAVAGRQDRAAWCRTCSNEVEVTCLPKDLPEFVDVDLSGLDINQMLHLSDLKVPEGVEIPELAHGREFAGGVGAPRACRGSRDADGRGGCCGGVPAAAAPAAAAAAAAAPAADAKAAAKPAAEAKGKDAKK